MVKHGLPEKVWMSEGSKDIHFQESILSAFNSQIADGVMNPDGFFYPATIFDSLSLAANFMANSGASAVQQNIISMLYQQQQQQQQLEQQQPIAVLHPPSSSTPNSTEDANDLIIDVKF